MKLLNHTSYGSYGSYTSHTSYTSHFLVLLALLLAIPAAAQQDYADCVVVILDASGSMDGKMGGTPTRKIDAAKAALTSVLTTLPETTHVGLLVFSGRNVPDPWVYPLGPRDNDALVKAINLPSPGGNTPLGQFIKKGADRLLEQRARQFGYGSYRLLVVTDGQATDGNLTDLYTPQVLARGITMDVIGVSMNEDHTLATKVHSYRRANDNAALQKALTEILAEVTPTGDDTASAEAFSLLKPLPPELCGAMLQALARVDNNPIGKPEQPTPANQSAARRPRPKQPAQPPKKPKDEDEYFPMFAVLVGIVVFLVVVGSAKSRRKR